VISYASTDEFARYPSVFNGKSKLGPKKLNDSYAAITRMSVKCSWFLKTFMKMQDTLVVLKCGEVKNEELRRGKY
jgi:hypothetical protein